MNSIGGILSLILIIITAFTMLFGLILGSGRGMKRSIFRIILIVIAFVSAMLIKNVVVDRAMSSTINNEKTLEEMITDIMANKQNGTDDGDVTWEDVNTGEVTSNPNEDSENTEISDEDIETAKKVSNVIKHIFIPLATALIGAIAFPFIFVVLQVLTWIIFLIGKIFIKPKDKYNKKKAAGAIIGLVQGFIIAFAICVPIAGLIGQFDKILSVVEFQNESAESNDLRDKVVGMSNVGGVKFYKKVGAPLFTALTTVDDGTGSGNKITLDRQTDAYIGVATIALDIGKLTDADFSQGIDREKMDMIKNSLASLDRKVDAMSDDTINIIDSAINSISSTFDLSVELGNIDIKNISFSSEGEALDYIWQYQNGEDVNVDDMIDSLVNSSIMLAVLVCDNTRIEVREQDAGSFRNAINSVQDEVTRNRLNSIFVNCY